MSAEALLGLWAESLPVSLIIWLVLLVVVLYAGRRWIEPLAATVLGGVDRMLRYSARSVRAAARWVDRRQRLYLRWLERERLDQRLYRELRGLHDRVNRDLGGYPVLQHSLHAQIQRLERDYHATEDVPPPEPAWLRTVADLAANPPQGDPAVARVLEDIHDGLQRASRASLEQYQAASRKRLELLRDMLPAWRALGERLRGVEQAIQGVTARSRQVDEVLSRERALADGGPELDAGLGVGAIGRTLLGLLLLGLMAVAAVMSFYLIQRPMAESFGMTETLGPWPLASVAAGLLIALGIAAGLLMTETRRVSGLVPALGTLDQRARARLFWAGLLVLLVVASLQGALAFSRDMLLGRDQWLALIMSGEPDPVMAATQWIPALTQMVMGVLLPLLLALSAVVLDTCLRHGRAVLGMLAALALHLLGFALGLAGRLVRWIAAIVMVIYGLLIFVPVKLEALVRQKVNGRVPEVGR
ncbi:hypothetical protein [Thioalkalivibrio sulfidiphilus]|uniref:hypothetical protein n=1 Tax=Thioalkalivibrio sulfidiphilus TaxID=1033854 RepID=UPI000371EC0A|nr:hypothetical protein [Thioalkalivibrio sulfidiphilus]